MPCPICGNDGPNCDCSPVVRRMHADAEELLDRVAALEAAVPRWIPVTERLPAEGKVVLVYDADYWCEQAESMWREGSANVGYHTGDHWMAFGHEADPTHWMPLPPPPGATP